MCSFSIITEYVVRQVMLLVFVQRQLSPAAHKSLSAIFRHSRSSAASRAAAEMLDPAIMLRVIIAFMHEVLSEARSGEADARRSPLTRTHRTVIR
jgi:hypothetical protein